MSQNSFNHSPLPSYVQLEHPSWSIDAAIYEVNIRQYTSEGTFRAFSKHLPRLKQLGVKILWLMPIHPIGLTKRKGSLGSPYAIADHFAINPEFGTEQAFKDLVDEIHQLGMYVIIDWVANHSAWDNPLTLSHPHWYKKTKTGEFCSTTWFDWDDIIEFDFHQTGLRNYMVSAMQHYLDDYDIDGFRCDVAGFVPLEFWLNARNQLDPEHQLFWLAEWEERDLHQRAFNMSYAWGLNDLLEDIAQGKRNAENLCGYFAKHNNAFPNNAIRMNFLDNHDKNAWDGSVSERFGAAEETLLALTLLMDGMPLIYSGQEVANEQSLAFFDHDPIIWPDVIERHPRHCWLQRLLQLKSTNPALQNGRTGGTMDEIPHSKRQQVIAFYRQNKRHTVVFIANLSPESVQIKLQTSMIGLPPLKPFITAHNDTNPLPSVMDFQGWEYQVYISD
ncbi:alpha-amlyase [Thalassotalea litorea]|uniref:Alpha-amlyase n=1 Tax=Thalassotalea litorea TaxID=2020715 RepID=A0A5R9INA8_9GAMM|nr:alpha-amylase family glycosyl hydrolase [Thalassotalea litorea]TLU61489.1 alpha-amlyase [Thalassotalea litorea]